MMVRLPPRTGMDPHRHCFGASIELAVLLGCLWPGVAGGQEWVPQGKALTDRSIEVSVVVEATAVDVFEYWTTLAGIRRFLAVDGEIEATVGGRYELFFLPRDHPEAKANSTLGARVLRIEPARMIAFEWSTTPLAPELSEGQFPLWVEVRLAPLDLPAGERTVVRLKAHGFGDGEDWDKVYEYDRQSWAEILFALDRALIDPSYTPPWIPAVDPSPSQPRTSSVVR